MSELSIGIIAEGTTDFIIIERILQILLKDQRLLITSIAPPLGEMGIAISSEEGFGWRGVYLTCRGLQNKLELVEAAGRQFDMIVIHLDGDVSQKSYKSANITDAENPSELPCYDAHLTISENAKRLEHIMRGWFSASLKQERITCIPFINTDTWAAHALYARDRRLISENWSETELYHYLLTRKKHRLIKRKKESTGKERIRKDTGTYRDAADAITINVWSEMRKRFEQAEEFSKQLIIIKDALN